MTDIERVYINRILAAVPQAASILSISVGLTVLLGWHTGNIQLTSIFYGLVAMKPNTAFCFILAGTALWTTTSKNTNSIYRLISLLFSGSVLLIGALALTEHLTHISFGIDQILFHDNTTLPGDMPGRMAFSTSVCFILLGAALLLLAWKKQNSSLVINSLTIALILIAGTALISYGYSIEDFLREKLNYTPMAVNTATVFVFLALGILNALPDYPFRRIMSSESSAGSTARRLLPAAVILQIVMGWLLLEVFDSGQVTAPVGFAIIAAVNIAGLGTLIQWNATLLYQSDSRRKLAEEALLRSERHNRELLEGLPTAVVVYGPDTSIRYTNVAAKHLLGDIASAPLWNFIDSKGFEVPTEEYPVNRAIHEKSAFKNNMIGILRSAHTETLWVYVSAFPTLDDQGNLLEVVATFVDMTERKKTEEKLRALQSKLREESIRDQLTGIYNRRYLEETLQRELDRVERDQQPLCILMADVDHFKKLNDTYGHQAGDQVLQYLGSLLLHHARKSDIPCRYGGEEFVLVLPNMPLDAAKERAELIREDFADFRISYQGSELRATLSIGIADYPLNGNTAEQLILSADKLLYKAKQTGRNRVCIPDIN